ncbi:MAG: hypothetical protein EBR09_08505 [Proteobacteria bacterium]|nr:hypothetical protein [Pseudomonadota bacterium]
MSKIRLLICSGLFLVIFLAVSCKKFGNGADVNSISSTSPTGEAWKLGPELKMSAVLDVSGGAANGVPDFNWSTLNLSAGSMCATDVINALSNAQTRQEFTSRRIFRVDLGISVFGAMAAKQGAIRALNAQVDAQRNLAAAKLAEARDAARSSQYSIAKGAILDAVLNHSGISKSVYNSDPALRAALAPIVDWVFEWKKPVIDAAIDGAVQAKQEEIERQIEAAVAEVKGRLETLERRNTLERFIVTVGGVSDSNRVFFYLQAGKGNVRAAPENCSGRTDIQNSTGMNDAVEQLAGYQLTTYVKAALVKVLSENTSLEVGVAALQSKGNSVPFISASQWTTQNLFLSKSEFDSGDKLFSLDTGMLQAILRSGPNKFFATFFSGPENKISIGSRVQLGSDKTYIHVMLLYADTKMTRDESKVYGRILLEHAITERLTATVGGEVKPCPVAGSSGMKACPVAEVGAIYAFTNNFSGSAKVAVSSQDTAYILNLRVQFR